MTTPITLDDCTVHVPGSQDCPAFELGLAQIHRARATVHRWLLSSDVHALRNRYTAHFLADPAKKPWLVQLDADIGFSMKEIEQLLAAAAEAPGFALVAAVYPLKAHGCGQLAWCLPEGERVILGEGGGIYATRWIGPGFSMISRASLERMVESELERGARMVAWDQPDGARAEMPPLWGARVQLDGGRYVCGGEDVGFCLRAAEADVRVLVDTRIRVTHWGWHAYDWQDALARRPERVAQLALRRANERRIIQP